MKEVARLKLSVLIVCCWEQIS